MIAELSSKMSLNNEDDVEEEDDSRKWDINNASRNRQFSDIINSKKMWGDGGVVVALKSTGSGNCLFNSISILKIGNDLHAIGLLRLLAALLPYQCSTIWERSSSPGQLCEPKENAWNPIPRYASNWWWTK